MSAGTIDKPTLVTLCDLCGNEIDTSRYSDYGQRGSIMGSNGVQATTRHKWMLMRWPSHEWIRKMGLRGSSGWREREKPENKERDYDFHGECIVALVDTAIAARKSRGIESS